jgi:hypothetical protein
VVAGVDDHRVVAVRSIDGVDDATDLPIDVAVAGVVSNRRGPGIEVLLPVPDISVVADRLLQSGLIIERRPVVLGFRDVIRGRPFQVPGWREVGPVGFVEGDTEGEGVVADGFEEVDRAIGDAMSPEDVGLDAGVPVFGRRVRGSEPAVGVLADVLDVVRPVVPPLGFESALGAPGPSVARSVEVLLAGVPRPIAVVIEDLTQHRCLTERGNIIAPRAVDLGVLPGEQRPTVRRTEWTGVVRPVEPDALRCQPVEIRRVDARPAVCPDHRRPLGVRHHEDDVHCSPPVSGGH